MAVENDERLCLLNELQVLRARVESLEAELSICDSGQKVQNCVFLNQNQKFFRSLISAIPDLVWVKDPQGVYLACNEAFERFFGAKEDKIVGKTDYDFVDRELADFFRFHDKRAMESDRPCVNEEWLTLAVTGDRILVETIKTPVKGDEGVLLGILGIARNITDRKLLEEELKKQLKTLTRPSDDSEQIEFSELFDIKKIQCLQDEFSNATGVASLITDPRGNPLTQPSNFCRLCSIIRGTEKGSANCHRSDASLGRPKSEGPSIQPCMSGGLWDAGAAITVGGHHVANWLIGQVRDESQSEESMRRYAREIGADENEVVEALSEVPSMSNDKFRQVSKVLFTLATQLSDIAYQNIRQARFIHDLTNTKAELADTRNYLSNIIDSMPSILVGLDADCKVTQWNMEAARDTGISSLKAHGQALSKVLKRIDAKKDHIDAAIQSRTPRSFFLETRQEGGVKHENVTVYPLVANGVQGAVVRIDDITERINMEKLLVQSEKMLSVGGLAAGMAHEINNPLAGILGAVTNINKRIFGDIPMNEQVAAECSVSLEGVRNYLRGREIPRMLDAIHESGARAAKIVHNMLSFSRKSESSFSKHNIVEILENTLELAGNDYNLKKHYDFRSIEITRDYDPSVPLVYCEKNELLQVFLNIFKNGAEAMTEKEFLNSRPGFICRVKRDGQSVIVQIEDNGPGMDKETCKRVFDPFYTTKQSGQGTGLGLSVSYFIIVDHHKGMLEVDSVLGEWTRFTIKLPVGR